jgi:hypothetical protein
LSSALAQLEGTDGGVYTASISNKTAKGSITPFRSAEIDHRSSISAVTVLERGPPWVCCFFFGRGLFIFHIEKLMLFVAEFGQTGPARFATQSKVLF